MKLLTGLLLFFFGTASYGQHVKNFTLTNVLNNQTVSLETFPSCSGLLIVFTSNNCPYDEHYRNRIAKISQAYQDRVPVLLVNSVPGETPAAMAQAAKKLNLSVPYLSDKDQTLMTELQARKTPEVFLLKNDNGKFSVVYKGAVDDNPQVEADVRHHYLRDAIDIMLTNQKIATPEVRAVGCNLKKK